MPTQEQYAPGEIVERGEQIYQQSIHRQVEKGNVGKYLAVNVETGDWVMGEDHLDTLRRARALYPNAGLYGLKVGYPATVSTGFAMKRQSAGPGMNRPSLNSPVSPHHEADRT